MGSTSSPDGTRRQLRDALVASPDHMRLVMTARDNTPDCPDGRIIHASRTDRAVMSRYLAERGIPKEARDGDPRSGTEITG